MCDGEDRPVRLHLTVGQVNDFRGADVLLAELSDETEEVIGDRRYDSNKSGSRSPSGISRPVSHRRRAGNQGRLAAGIFIKSVTSAKT